MLDGVNNNGGGTHEISARVNMDAVQEFKVQTNTYGAQYGRFPGAQVDMVTKSGTNSIHGNLFYFGRNSALDSRNVFDPYPDTVKPQLRRHQYGATIGGPLQKDKTFFFYGFQGQRQFQLNTKIGTLPLPNFWGGDFSKLTTPLKDPALAAQGLPCTASDTRGCFPGNIIPSNRISQQALLYRQFYPAATNLNSTVQNYTAHLPAPDDYRLMNGRVDHTFSPKHNIFAAYTYHHEDLIEYPIAGNPTIPDFASDGHIYSQLLAISDVYTFTPKVINEFRTGFNRAYRGQHQYPAAQLQPGLHDRRQHFVAARKALHQIRRRLLQERSEHDLSDQPSRQSDLQRFADGIRLRRFHSGTAVTDFAKYPWNL
jgi:hypothetical protein